MSRFDGRLARAAVITALAVAAAFACGPFLGIEALQNRGEFLLAPPSISFGTELKALVPAPKDKLPVIESANGRADINRATVEVRELSPAVLARINAMGEQSGGEAAYVAGYGLPRAIQLYTAGAVSFLHDQTQAARTYFQDILSLPAEERKTRELWAHFMLGRVAIRQGDQTEAVAQFEEVRAFVRQGMPDQLGLAVASLGEQARGSWRQGDVAGAVGLYAQQASYGSQSGANSLLTVANLILKSSDLLEKGIQDDVTRRLLFISINSNNSPRFLTDFDVRTGTDSTAERIAAALERHHFNRVEGAGLLASAAYSQGRFDLAQKLASDEDGPMSAWVTGKLALRRGDRETALQEYEKALRTLQPAMGDPTKMKIEFATLRVSRRDYLQALELFYRAAGKGWNAASQFNGFADYWGDAAYLAERVLTVQEIQDFLEHTIPLSAASTAADKSERSRLSSVLARRLMRAGRRREALRFFDDQSTRTAAEQYVAALDKAARWWRPRLVRAEWWFTAAKFARGSGIRLLAFEKEPDFAIWDGQLSAVSGNPKLADPYESEDERKRVAASKPARDVRFQYRLTAVDEAMRAADLLPRHSQAFCGCALRVGKMDHRSPTRASPTGLPAVCQ